MQLQQIGPPIMKKDYQWQSQLASHFSRHPRFGTMCQCHHALRSELFDVSELSIREPKPGCLKKQCQDIVQSSVANSVRHAAINFLSPSGRAPFKNLEIISLHKVPVKNHLTTIASFFNPKVRAE
jgi:hypothetical protein